MYAIYLCLQILDYLSQELFILFQRESEERTTWGSLWKESALFLARARIRLSPPLRLEGARERRTRKEGVPAEAAAGPPKDSQTRSGMRRHPQRLPAADVREEQPALKGGKPRIMRDEWSRRHPTRPPTAHTVAGGQRSQQNTG